MYVGAEARVTVLKNKVVKDRVPKAYRIKVIDESLRRSRTRREAKILAKLHSAGFPVPSVIEMDDQAMKLTIERIEGKRLVDHLENLDYNSICKQIGESVAQMHNLEIVHGDLTTSNMILRDKTVVFIDFGLAYVTKKVEDKAVDLHLLRQALDSKHYTIAESCYRKVIAGYKSKSNRCREILKRLEVVEGRGRNKGKH